MNFSTIFYRCVFFKICLFAYIWFYLFKSAVQLFYNKKIPLKQKLVETNQINFCFHLKKKRNETIYINWIIRPKYFLVFKYFPNVFQSVCYTISLFPNGDRFQSFACFLITLLDIWSTSKGHQTEKALMKKIDGLKRSFIFDSRQILLIRFKFIIQGCLQLSSMKTSLI